MKVNEGESAGARSYTRTARVSCMCVVRRSAHDSAHVRALKLRDRSSAENGVSSRDYRDPRTLGYVPSCVPFARAARLAVPLLQ